ncbi:integrase catalytic domain-containing protein [Trichonephila clavipes]|nr:integrase catalytic domain-containing protein [Trichonephila clavipes]
MVGRLVGKVVRIIKELLRRSLGKSILSYEELSTVIFDCEFLINSRPLTYISENPQELIPLTPAMFLIENRCSDTTDIDELNLTDLRKRMKYRIKLLSDLRQRFRKEYLSELIQKQNDNRVREPRIGEMVLIGNDNKKRLSWPIAKIIELIPGRDGEIRTVRLKTQHGTVIRPVNVSSLWNPLTPGHFPIGRPHQSLPEPDMTDKLDNRLSQWQKLTKFVQFIWRKWRLDYLNNLQARHKWQFEKENVTPNSMAILKDENLPQCKWTMGRILEIVKGSDGKVRVVKVKTPQGIFKRGISKICLLPNV